MNIAAVLVFMLCLVALPLLLAAMIKKSWRPSAWRGLKIGLALLAISFGAAIATMAPKEVREAEALERAEQSAQRSKEQAAKVAAEAEAARLADAKSVTEKEIAAGKLREREARESAARQAAEASARDARQKQLEAEAIEATKAARTSAAALASGTPASSTGQSGQVLGPKPLVRDLIGCKNRDAYDRLAKIAASGDQAALVKLGTSLVLSGTCRSLNAGTLVHLEDTAIFSALMCARPAGDVNCYWMAIDATK